MWLGVIPEEWIVPGYVLGAFVTAFGSGIVAGKYRSQDCTWLMALFWPALVGFGILAAVVATPCLILEAVTAAGARVRQRVAKSRRGWDEA